MDNIRIANSGPIVTADKLPGDKLEELLAKYNRLNSGYGDKSAPQLLVVARQIEALLTSSVDTIGDSLLRNVADVFRDEYGAKHGELSEASRRILGLLPYGQRVQQSLANLASGDFLDDSYDQAFLRRVFEAQIDWVDHNGDGLASFDEVTGVELEQWQNVAGADNLLSLAEASQFKREQQILEFLLPHSVQQVTNQELVYLKPGDLLFTGRARRSDSTGGLYNAHYWGNLFGVLGMDKMHVGVYIGDGKIIESGEDESTNWHGVVTEDIYDSIFSTNILNGATTILPFSTEQRQAAVSGLLQQIGTAYDFLHNADNEQLDCIQLVNAVYSDLGVLAVDQQFFKPDGLYNTSNSLLNFPDNYDDSLTVRGGLTISNAVGYRFTQGKFSISATLEPQIGFNEIVKIGLPIEVAAVPSGTASYRAGLAAQLFPSAFLGLRLSGGVSLEDNGQGLNAGGYFSAGLLYQPLVNGGLALNFTYDSGINHPAGWGITLGLYFDPLAK